MVSAAPQLLDAQLDLLQDRVDRWQLERGAIIQGDVEDLMALALETLDRIRKRCDAAPANGDTKMLLEYWRRWHEIAVRALVRVDALARQRKLEQADAFRFAVNEASMARDWDRVLAAQQRLEAGGGRSLEEIDNALSRQAG